MTRMNTSLTGALRRLYNSTDRSFAEAAQRRHRPVYVRFTRLGAMAIPIAIVAPRRSGPPERKIKGDRTGVLPQEGTE